MAKHTGLFFWISVHVCGATQKITIFILFEQNKAHRAQMQRPVFLCSLCSGFKSILNADIPKHCVTSVRLWPAALGSTLYCETGAIITHSQHSLFPFSQSTLVNSSSYYVFFCVCFRSWLTIIALTGPKRSFKARPQSVALCWMWTFTVAGC